MRTIKTPDVFRANVRTKFQSYLPDENICKNLEKGIYNYCIKEATERQIVKKWDNVYFTHLYLDKLRSVYANLKNPQLVARITNKEVKPHEVAFMTHQEIIPEKWAILLSDKKIREENIYAPKLEASTDGFTCRKCKSKECSYYQLQTRSADEPMTTFVTCIKCGTRWKC
uniref:TFIIS-type domain-containing protein n=1 Tax=viral metagenome TaxID=1070528 RepID=A0A6C0IIX5_9ZZZZ